MFDLVHIGASYLLNGNERWYCKLALDDALLCISILVFKQQGLSR